MSLSDWFLLLSPWVALTALIIWDTRTQRTTTIVVHDKNTYERALVNWTRVLSISTIGLVGATIVSAYILHRTDDAIHRSLEVFERDEQPYVELTTNRQEEPHFEAGTGQLHWNFSFANLGKRAAKNFSIRKFVKLAGQQFEEGPPQGEAAEDFGPNASAWTTVSHTNVTLAEFQRLMKQDGGITVLIEFRYRDAVNKQHLSAFCITRFANAAIAYMNTETCQKELKR